jgi:diguanylate cyclase (GGDEF)-like protein
VQTGRNSLIRILRSANTWIILGMLAPIGMLLVSGLMLLDLRRDAWSKAELNASNLLQLLERDIARNIEIIDLALRGLLDNLKEPRVAQLGPELRQRLVFDRITSARDMGTIVVFDEHGTSLIESGSMPPRQIAGIMDRTYFTAHRDHADLGLYISGPVVTTLTASSALMLSRRIDKSDGSFGGVAVASLRLTFFSRLFRDIGVGHLGLINLYRKDGMRIMRYPYDAAMIGESSAGTPNFERFILEGRGTFTSRTFSDGIVRHHTFGSIGNLPLILSISLSADEVEAEWREKALVISGIVLVLCGLTMALSLLFGRELRRRSETQAELARLSDTDALTGLSNRRRFETAFDEAWKDAIATGEALSLLVVDADHFKRFNDRYGHAVGDAVLVGLGVRLAASVHRPEDVVFRVGGEEFTLLLRDTDVAGALRVAQKIHAEVAKLTVASAFLAAGSVTVSIGLATAVPASPEAGTTGELYRRADGALYEAKAGGRNQTRCAVATAGLRLVARRLTALS